MIIEDGSKLTFQEELENLINRHSKESASNTPDYVLAKYLNNCLEAFDQAIQMRHSHSQKDK